MPMKNSLLSDDFVARWVAENPIHIGPTGNIITCPVRLGWINLFRPGEAQKGDDGTERAGNYNAQIWFPPGAEAGIANVLMPVLLKVFDTSFGGEHMKHPENPFAAQNFTPEWVKAVYAGLGQRPSGQRHMPFRDQFHKQQYGGTPGLAFVTASTQNKPQVVDPAFNPIVDEGRAYPGVWALVTLNAYVFGVKPKQRPVRGVQFGLQSVMIIGDDNKLAASAPPAKDDFAGVKITQHFDPSGQFGGTRAPGAAPSALPPATPVYAGQAVQPAGYIQGLAPSYAPPAALPPPTPGPYLPPGMTNEQALYGAPPALPALPPPPAPPRVNLGDIW